MNLRDQSVLLLKILLFTFILLSPLMTPLNKYFWFLNHSIAKVIMLTLICVFCFIDFQLALIATVAFLILIINLNNSISSKMQRDNFVENASLLDMQFSPPVVVPEAAVDKNIVCHNQQPTNNVNEDMLSHYIDDKIKPYDVFIRMMTDESSLQKAQGDHL